ncbi:uncharacterized protein LOC100905389 [Galendromus occidentalis]|uniref:protein-synthesizing GTPase n=1 Tax=Galendromus occidentalis TaxID=34638 RepID=A0AAJ6QUC1_9ACAR|nr:uncharacterized protein LOC100905389 [Galendromus occidentalis]
MLWRSFYFCVRNKQLIGVVRSKSTTSKPKASERKVNLNVGTIGHVDHGKTSLTAAITKYLSQKSTGTKYVSYDSIDNAELERIRGITINASHVSYETETRHYSHTDCPGHADFIKNMICGTAQMDGAVLVVAADDGCMPQTNEHLLVCKQLGVDRIIPFINKADISDRDTIELIELEIRDLMESLKFPNADTCPVIYGSAKAALEGDQGEFGEPSLQRLLDAMDAHFQLPLRDTTSPLLAPVDGVVSVKNRGTVIITTIEKGTVKKNDKLELLGFDARESTSVADIQAFGEGTATAQAGDHVGILCRGLKAALVKRGMTLVAPGAYKTHNRFSAQLYLLSKEEGGHKNPISQKFIMRFFAKSWNVMSRVDVKDGAMLMPGDAGEVVITLAKKMLLGEGQSFTIKENNVTLASGKITGILPDVFLSSSELGKNRL